VTALKRRPSSDVPNQKEQKLFRPTCPTNSVQIVRTLSCCAFHLKAISAFLEHCFCVNLLSEASAKTSIYTLTLFRQPHPHNAVRTTKAYQNRSNYPRDSYDVRATLGYFCNPSYVYLANILQVSSHLQYSTTLRERRPP
jgi:hypothetical protein